MNEQDREPTGPDSVQVGDASERSMAENFRDVVLDPEVTFEDVAERPKWLMPLIVLAVVTLIVSYFMMPLWAEMQAEALAEQDLSAEQLEQQRQMMETFKWVGLAMAPIMTALISLLWGFLFWGWGTIAGAKNSRFAVALTAVVYAGLIYIFQSIAQAIVVVAKGAETVAAEGGPPTFGLTLLIERGEMSGLVWAFLSNVNFFSIWYAVVIAIAGQHALKMSKGASWGFAIAGWVLAGLLMTLQPAG